MIKKALILLAKIILGIILLIILAYYSFLGWEYITGGKYVDYLNNNKETVGIDDSFSYELMENDLAQNKLILVGEIHGFEEPTKFDIHFFKHLYNNFGVRTYFAELDYSQAIKMNEYFKTGNEDFLKAALENWVVIQGRNNKDYFDKYRAFHQFYQELPEDDKFIFMGVDKMQDWNLLTEYINQLSEIENTLSPIVYNEETGISQLKERARLLIAKVDSNSHFELNHILKNIQYKEEKTFRENVLFQNFYDLYKEKGLSNEKVYGYFGLAHVFQYRLNGNHPLASQIRLSDLGLENDMLSMNFLFVDSYNAMKSNMLPEGMRDEGKYTRMKITSDNLLFMYIYGIQDFKRTTPENHKSIIKMNAANSPYSNSGRLSTMYQILPVTDLFEMTDKGKPYTQYTIFVRNSDWAKPMDD